MIIVTGITPGITQWCRIFCRQEKPVGINLPKCICIKMKLTVNSIWSLIQSSYLKETASLLPWMQTMHFLKQTFSVSNIGLKTKKSSVLFPSLWNTLPTVWKSYMCHCRPVMMCRTDSIAQLQCLPNWYYSIQIFDEKSHEKDL